MRLEWGRPGTLLFTISLQVDLVIHQFRWPGLMYDISVAREVAFSCANMRLKRRLGWEDGKEEVTYFGIQC